MTPEELYAMEAETGRTSEWEPLYRAEKARADADEARLAERDRWMADNLREIDEGYEPWWAPIVEVSESGDRWREACERAEAAVARVRALHEADVRAFALDRYTGSPEDQADAVVDLIARELDAP